MCMTFKNFSNSLKRALNKIIKINTITSLLKPFTIQDKATSKLRILILFSIIIVLLTYLLTYFTSLFLLQDMHKGLLGYRRGASEGMSMPAGLRVLDLSHMPGWAWDT